MLMGLDLYLVQQQAVEKFQRVVKIIFYSMTPRGGCSCSALYWFVASSTLQLGVDAHAIDVPYVEKVIQAAEFHRTARKEPPSAEVQTSVRAIETKRDGTDTARICTDAPPAPGGDERLRGIKWRFCSSSLDQHVAPAGGEPKCSKHAAKRGPSGFAFGPKRLPQEPNTGSAW